MAWQEFNFTLSSPCNDQFQHFSILIFKYLVHDEFPKFQVEKDETFPTGSRLSKPSFLTRWLELLASECIISSQSVHKNFLHFLQKAVTGNFLQPPKELQFQHESRGTYRTCGSARSLSCRRCWRGNGFGSNLTHHYLMVWSSDRLGKWPLFLRVL